MYIQIVQNNSAKGLFGIRNFEPYNIYYVTAMKKTAQYPLQFEYILYKYILDSKLFVRLHATWDRLIECT